MFDKIVVAIDGSPSSGAALSVAGRLASKTGSDIDIVHVHEHDMPHSKAVRIADLETHDEAESIVTAAVAQLVTDGVAAHGHVLESTTHDVPQRIMDYAQASGADVIIVGRRRLSSLTSMLIGSVSNQLVHLATVPVIVAR
jgi:nucleotide-binding universal stress UspA family protein